MVKIELEPFEFSACLLTALLRSQLKYLDDLLVGGTDITMTGLSKYLHCKPTKLTLANTQFRDSDVKLLTEISISVPPYSVSRQSH